MKTLINTFLAIANIFVLFICSTAYGADNAELERFKSVHTDSYLNGNAQALADYLADEVRLMPAYQQTVLGKENAMIYHAAFLERSRVAKYSRTRRCKLAHQGLLRREYRKEHTLLAAGSERIAQSLS